MKRIVLLVVVLFLVGCSLEGAVVQSVVEDSGAISVYFCPGDDCAGKLVGFLDSAVESLRTASMILQTKYLPEHPES